MSAHTACVPIDTSAKTLNVMGTASQNPILKRGKKETNVLLKYWKHLPQESWQNVLGEKFLVAVYCCPSGISGHSKDNKNNMAPLPQGCQWEERTGKPGQGFRHSLGARQKLENWVVEDSHPHQQVWAVLLPSHLGLRVCQELLLLLGMEGRLVGGRRGGGLWGACCPPAPCLAAIHTPCSLPGDTKEAQGYLGHSPLSTACQHLCLVRALSIAYSFHHNKIWASEVSAFQPHSKIVLGLFF